MSWEVFLTCSCSQATWENLVRQDWKNTEVVVLVADCVELKDWRTVRSDLEEGGESKGHLRKYKLTKLESSSGVETKH